MDVHPTKNCIFIGIDPYSYNLLPSGPLVADHMRFGCHFRELRRIDLRPPK